MRNKNPRPSRRIRVKSTPPHSQGLFTLISESELERYPKLTNSDYTAADEVLEWLQSRWRISQDVINRYDLRLYLDEATGEGGVAFITNSPDGHPVALHRMMLDESLQLKTVKCRGQRGSTAVPFWFGQDVEVGSPTLVLTSHPLDMLRLATLGIRGAIASCGVPTKTQLDNLSTQTVYTAFGTRGAEYTCMPICLMALSHMKRFSLDWGDVGITYARELDSLPQFKKVFLEKQKWISAP